MPDHFKSALESGQSKSSSFFGVLITKTDLIRRSSLIFQVFPPFSLKVIASLHFISLPVGHLTELPRLRATNSEEIQSSSYTAASGYHRNLVEVIAL